MLILLCLTQVVEQGLIAVGRVHASANEKINTIEAKDTEWNKAVYRTNWADNGPSSVSPTHCDGQVESCWGSQFGQFKPCTAVLRYDFAAFLRFHVYAFMISHQIINKTCY